MKGKPRCVLGPELIPIIKINECDLVNYMLSEFM